MKRKQFILLLVIVGVLAVLVYFQFRTWRRFDWEKFKSHRRRHTAGTGYVYLGRL